MPFGSDVNPPICAPAQSTYPIPHRVYGLLICGGWVPNGSYWKRFTEDGYSNSAESYTWTEALTIQQAIEHDRRKDLRALSVAEIHNLIDACKTEVMTRELKK